jgi:outer membrane murein-binding lipoprotein Lpp
MVEQNQNQYSVLRLSNYLASVLVSLLISGTIGSFSLLWSMSHTLTRISDRIETLASQLQSLNAAQIAIQRDIVLFERRLSILEQKVTDYGK